MTIDPPGECHIKGRELAFKLGLKWWKQINNLPRFLKLAQLLSKRFSLVEVNPLSGDEEGSLICVDAKVGIDDLLYRHPDLLALRDLSQSDAQ